MARLQLIEYSPAELLKDIVLAHQAEPMRHLTDLEMIGHALLAIERTHTALPVTRAFIRILPYLFTRPTEIRALAWPEINQEGDLISIAPGEVIRFRSFR